MKESLELLVLLISVTTAVGGGIAWYSASVRKRYAAERAFAHLRRILEQNQQAIALLSDDIESMDRALGEMRITQQAVYTRMEAIAARLDVTTGGWARRE